MDADPVPQEKVQHNGRFAYCGLFFFAAAVIVIIISIPPSDLLTKLPSNSPPSLALPQLEFLTILRFSFALAIFHLIHSIFLCGDIKSEGDFRDQIQNGYWIFKFPIFCALVVGAFGIPIQFYTVYDYFCRVGGFLFILLQILILIDFSYSWNSKWVNHDSRLFYTLIVIVSFSLLALSLALLVVLFVFYGGGGCDLNNFFVSMTLILSIFMVGGSMVVEHGAILPASVIVSYCSFLCWSAINGVSETCDRISGDGSNQSIAVIVVGAVFAIVSLCYQSLSATQSQDLLSYKAIPKDRPTHDSVSFFHFVFFLGSLYLPMLLTGWRNFDADTMTSQSSASMWVKIVSQWLVFLVYGWSLIAPKVLKNRDFGYAV